MSSYVERRLFFCEECGSPDIEVSAWVHLNEWRIVDGEGPSTLPVYCPDCEDQYKRFGDIPVPIHGIAWATAKARIWSAAFHRDES
jgi:hypothetical protein